MPSRGYAGVACARGRHDCWPSLSTDLRDLRVIPLAELTAVQATTVNRRRDCEAGGARRGSGMKLTLVPPRMPSLDSSTPVTTINKVGEYEVNSAYATGPVHE